MPEDINQGNVKIQRVEKKGRTTKTFFLLLSYVIVGIIVWQVQAQFSSSPERQQELARKEVQEIVDRVKKIMLLPENEFPQMATVDQAPELAKTQAFFAKVENGDKVLIYIQDQKAILFRPSTGKIVNVGPVVADNTQTDQSSQAVRSQAQVPENTENIRTGSKTTSTSTKQSSDDE